MPQCGAEMKFVMGLENPVFCTATPSHSAGVSSGSLTMGVCSPECKTVKMRGTILSVQSGSTPLQDGPHHSCFLVCLQDSILGSIPYPVMESPLPSTLFKPMFLSPLAMPSAVPCASQDVPVSHVTVGVLGLQMLACLGFCVL